MVVPLPTAPKVNELSSASAKLTGVDLDVYPLYTAGYIPYSTVPPV